MALGLTRDDYLWLSGSGLIETVETPIKRQRGKWCVVHDPTTSVWRLDFANKGVPFNTYIRFNETSVTYYSWLTGRSIDARDVHRTGLEYKFLEEVFTSYPETLNWRTLVLGVTYDGDFHILIGNKLDLIATLNFQEDGRLRFNKGILGSDLQLGYMWHTIRSRFLNYTPRHSSDVDNQRFNRAVFSEDDILGNNFTDAERADMPFWVPR